MEKLSARSLGRLCVGMLLVVAVASCSNMFSTENGSVGDLQVAFEAQLLFSATGSAAAGTPYLIPTADTIEATLSRSSGSSNEENEVITQPLTLAAGSDHTVSSVFEFASVPVNTELAVAIRIFASSDPTTTLHSGTITVAPITRAQREERVTIQVDPDAINATIAPDAAGAPLSLGADGFALYRLNVTDGAQHTITAQLNGTDLASLRTEILTSGLRRSDVSPTLADGTLSGTLPASTGPYYLAVYNPAGGANVEGLVTIEASEGLPEPEPEPEPEPSVFFVSTTGSSGATGTSSDPFASIQEAVNTAQAGETIQIGSGVFTEAVVIDKDLTLSGEGSAATTLTVATDLTTVTVDGGATVSITNLRIENETPQNARSAVHLVSGSLSVAGAELSAGAAAGTGPVGLRVSAPEPDSSLVLRSSTIFPGESVDVENGSGVLVEPAFAGTVQIGGPNAADGNTFASAGASIDGVGALQHISFTGQSAATSTTIRNNTFESLLVDSAVSHGSISVQNMSNELFILDNDIAGNRPQNGNLETLGLSVTSVGPVTIRGNTIRMGEGQDVTVGPPANIGIIVTSGDPNPPNTVIDRNRIVLTTGTSSDQRNRGIQILRDNVTVLNNLIVQEGTEGNTSTFRGVDQIDSANSNIRILHNTIVNNRGGNSNSDLVFLQAPSEITLANNILGAIGTGTHRGVFSPSLSFGRIETNVFWNTNDAADLLSSGPGNMAIDPALEILPATEAGAFAPKVSAPMLVRSGGVDTFVDNTSVDFLDSATVDINGDPRNPGTVTIGAYEVEGGDVIGQAGPAGGWIFYVNPNYAAVGWRFMEAAPEDEFNAAVWMTENVSAGTTPDQIGSGLENTQAIVEAVTTLGQSQTGTAAQAANDLISGGADDWFLPSLNELVEMYDNLAFEGIGNFTLNDTYWSSTEADLNNAQQVLFTNMDRTIQAGAKNIAYLVRPVRRF